MNHAMKIHERYRIDQNHPKPTDLHRIGGSCRSFLVDHSEFVFETQCTKQLHVSEPDTEVQTIPDSALSAQASGNLKAAHGQNRANVRDGLVWELQVRHYAKNQRCRLLVIPNGKNPWHPAGSKSSSLNVGWLTSTSLSK